jgi:hypothetical protein
MAQTSTLGVSACPTLYILVYTATAFVFAHEKRSLTKRRYPGIL